MRDLRSLGAMRRLTRQWRAGGAAIGLVPTMGYLHAGHGSLIRRARSLVGSRGRVVVSLYVNPTQFAAHEDLGSYPRDVARDRRFCREEGVDAIWLPSDGGMYPEGCSTVVEEGVLSRRMEGVSRPTHFRGVTTVVAMLLNVVEPDVAVFGAKDYQQAMVVRRMVRDLHYAVRVVVVPTVREPDGLALSSRNAYLSGEERRQACVLSRALREARRWVRERPEGGRSAPLLRRLKRMIESQPLARVDYVEVFDGETLEPVSRVRRGVHLAMAVWVGKTRLIDNGRL